MDKAASPKRKIMSNDSSDITQATSNNNNSNNKSSYFHCYLLRSCDPKHPYKTYIGFTTDPHNRIRQHNGILKAGGARRTKRSGRPWEFVAIVHGFPDKITALQFEWAFQHPDKSLHVREVLGDRNAATMGRKRGVKAKLTILKAMLNECDNYQYFPLEVYFLHEKWEHEFLSAKYDDGLDFESTNTTAAAATTTRPTHVVTSLEEMPFWINKPTKKNKKKKQKKEGKILHDKSITVDDDNENDATRLDNGNNADKKESMEQQVKSKSEKKCCYLCGFLVIQNSGMAIICECCSTTMHEFCFEDSIEDSCKLECPSCHSKLDWSPDTDSHFLLGKAKDDGTMTIDKITNSMNRRFSIDDDSSVEILDTNEENKEQTVSYSSDEFSIRPDEGMNDESGINSEYKLNNNTTTLSRTRKLQHNNNTNHVGFLAENLESDSDMESESDCSDIDADDSHGISNNDCYQALSKRSVGSSNKGILPYKGGMEECVSEQQDESDSKPTKISVIDLCSP